jgi:NADH-ubiquinone oxidoreductase chain 5
MFLLILLLPLLGFFSGSLFGRYLGKGVCFVTTGLTFLSFVFSFSVLLNVIQTGEVVSVVFKDWIYSDTIRIDWNFYFDSLTCIMLVVVTFVSSLVHLYSTEYMEHDPHIQRFMSYLSLFTFFMLVLITGDNFVLMFVGWEGVGVSSYLLINFWFTRIQANKSAIKAMLVNRIGDFFLLLGIMTIYFVFHSVDYQVVFQLVPSMIGYKVYFSVFSLEAIDLICIFLFLGAMGKSAQLGLHTWLPDAMEGPTPVSALIHAATMVTAGVFLLTRCSYLFQHSIICSNFIILVGAMTAFFAATTGLFQNDMKKVIAYSTCSQLGYMIFACGLSSYDVALFHLSNHAVFKALLFLGAGSVIHSVGDEQDMRKLGGIKNTLPFTYSVIFIGSLALTGFPFLAGFYSKDIILEIGASTYTSQGQFAYFLGIFAAFFTAFYSIRLLYFVFLSNSNGNKNILLNVHESTWRIKLPLFLLSIFSITIGYLSKDLFIGFGTPFWGTAIFIQPYNLTIADIEYLPLEFKLLPLLVTLLGMFSSDYLYIFKDRDFYNSKQLPVTKFIFYFFNKKWYFDRVYNQFIVQNILSTSYYYFYQTIDRGLIEQIGPFGISTYFLSVSHRMKHYQSGYILHYLAYFLFFFFVFFFLSVSIVSFYKVSFFFLATFFFFLSR